MSVNVNTTDFNSKDLIKIGQLKKPYGIKGWLWVFSDTDNRETIFAMQPWYIKTATGMKPLTVIKWRKQGAGLVAQFEQIPDRNIAETMNGVSIWTSKDSLPQNDEDGYYWSDLIGLTVQTNAEECLGKISELFETGAHDIMTVKPTADSVDNETRLIPWHKQTVVSVDLDNKVVVVDWQTDY